MMLFLTRLLAGGLEQAGAPTLQPLLLLQLFFLVAFLSICVAAGPWRDADAILAGMCGVAAMAVQNALLQISLTKTPTTAVMTTNVTHFMLDLGEVLVGRDPAHVVQARADAHLAGDRRLYNWVCARRSFATIDPRYSVGHCRRQASDLAGRTRLDLSSHNGCLLARALLSWRQDRRVSLSPTVAQKSKALPESSAVLSITAGSNVKSGIVL
jgi:hypothetical protein